MSACAFVGVPVRVGGSICISHWKRTGWPIPTEVKLS